MPAPNVTVQIVDESFVARGSETISNTVGSAFSYIPDSEANLLTILGSSQEQSLGYMNIASLPEWVQRYNTKFGGLAGITANGTEGHPFLGIPQGLTGVTLSSLQSPNPTAGITLPNGFIYNGLGGTLATHWWSVANFLQYGGFGIISGKVGNTFTYLVNPVMDKNQFPDVDVVFALDGTNTQAAVVTALVGGRNYDCVGVVGVSGSYVGYASAEGIPGVCYQSGEIDKYAISESMEKNGIAVYGSKVHFGLDLDESELITTPLAADVAGCICRTDRDFGPWWSPAGFARGRILNSIRLLDQPSVPNQNTLYDDGINFALTVSGQGTFLFGDRTMESNTSTFSRINVARLFIYLVNTIGPLAKRFLFELNDEITRNQFTSVVDGELARIQAQRGITEYRIICDETNNTPSVIDANEFVADILVKPAKSINFITIRFTNQNT